MAQAAPDHIIGVRKSLLEAACGDSVHDFHNKLSLKDPKQGQAVRVGIADVLPGLPEVEGSQINHTNYKKEDDLLGDFFKLNLGEKDKFTITKLIDYLIEKKDSDYKDFIKIPGIKPEPHNYTMKLLHSKKKEGVPHSEGYNIRNMYDLINIKEYRTFFDLAGDDPLNLVIDAQTVGINTLFSKATIDEGDTPLRVNTIINREVINDPAPKTYDIDKLGKGNSAKYQIILDRQDDNIIYSKFDDNIESEFKRSMFFSKFDFTLSKLITEGKTLPWIYLVRVDIFIKQIIPIFLME